MKLLLIPGNNSLSHIAKCLALATELCSRGHCTLIAVSKKHVSFLEHLPIQVPFAVLPDIQETDGGPSPSWDWFRQINLIQHCIRAEIDLMRRFQPDRVLGVFRFTTRIAAEAAGIPFDSLICGSMLADAPEVLGFTAGEDGAGCQAEYLYNFFAFAGRKLSRAAKPFGYGSIPDARNMLEGENTFLWDFPEFMPLCNKTNRYHVGPLRWAQWPDFGAPEMPFMDSNRPLSLISFGTCWTCRPAAEKMTESLLDQGFNVLIAAAGQADMMNVFKGDNRVAVWPFAPMNKLIDVVSLVVCHGGQMTMFECLGHGIPLLVMPFQPEQAHNGVCLERLGCGRRLIPSVAYKGSSDVYVNALSARSRLQIDDTIRYLANDPDISMHLAQTRKTLHRYNGAAMILELLEQI